MTVHKLPHHTTNPERMKQKKLHGEKKRFEGEQTPDDVTGGVFLLGLSVDVTTTTTMKAATTAMTLSLSLCLSLSMTMRSRGTFLEYSLPPPTFLYPTRGHTIVSLSCVLCVYQIRFFSVAFFNCQKVTPTHIIPRSARTFHYLTICSLQINTHCLVHFGCAIEVTLLFDFSINILVHYTLKHLLSKSLINIFSGVIFQRAFVVGNTAMKTN